MQPVWQGISKWAGEHSEEARAKMAGLRDALEHDAKMLAIGFGIGLIGGAVAAAYTAYRIVSGSIGFIHGLFTGEAYKTESIDHLVKMSDTLQDIQGKYRVSAQEAAAYSVVAKQMGTDIQTVAAAQTLGSAAAASHADEFSRLGIVTKDAAGNMLPERDVLTAIKSKLEEYTAGSERAAAAAALGVGSYDAVSNALKMQGGMIDEAKGLAEDYQIVLSQQQRAAVEEYQDAMKNFGRSTDMTSEGFKTAIADGIMPILTDLAVNLTAFKNWLMEGYPAAVRVFRGVSATVSTIFYGIKEVVSIVTDSVVGSAKVIMDLGSGIGEAIKALMSGDFSGAGAAMTAAFAKSKESVGQTFDGMVAHAEKTQERIKMAFGMDDKTVEVKGKKFEAAPTVEDDTPEEKAGPAVNRMAQWEADLDARKVMLAEQARAEGTFREMSKAEEMKYWQDMMKSADISEAERLALRKKVSADALSISKGEFDLRMESLRVEGDAYRNNFDERIRLAELAYTETAARYGAESKEARKAYGDILALGRQLVDQQAKLDEIGAASSQARQIADIQAAKDGAQAQVDLGMMSKSQMLAAEKGFEDQLYQIKLKGLQDKLALTDPALDPVAYAQMTQQIEQAELEHQGRMRTLKAALQKEDAQPTLNLLAGAEQSFGQSIDAMLQGGQKLQTNLNQIWSNLGRTFQQEMITKPLSAWAMRMVRESALHQMMTGQKTAAQTAASAQVVATKAGEATAVVAADAVEAGAGAAASQAAIPVVGPEMAMASMAAIMGAVLALGGSIPSAAGGFDIGRGVNPLTQLHEQEMVLPKAHANTIRGLGDAPDMMQLLMQQQAQLQQQLTTEITQIAVALAPSARAAPPITVPRSMLPGQGRGVSPDAFDLEASPLSRQETDRAGRGGSGAAASGLPAAGEMRVEVHINGAMDGADVRRVLLGNVDVVAEAMRRAYRDFQVKPG